MASTYQPHTGNASRYSASGHLPLPANATSKLGAHRVSTYGSHPNHKPLPGKKMADETHENRMDLVKKMCHILSLQLFLTAIIAVPVKMLGSLTSWNSSQFSQYLELNFASPPWIQTHSGWLWVSIVILLACMLVMAKLGSMLQTSPANYISLLILTILMGVVVGFISALDTWKSLWLDVVISAVIFALLSAYARLAKSYFDFKYGPYVFAVICAILVFGITICILIFFEVKVSLFTQVCDIIAVLILSFYMIFDTQWILGDCIDDGASAVLDLYLDIIRWLSAFLGYFAYKH
jgi:FtsH-binding integral membrane protein